MDKWKTEEGQIRILLAGMILAAAMVLLPLFLIAHYNFRSADDYTFGQAAEAVGERTGSVFQVLKEQFFHTKDFYEDWQGTYFDVWLTGALLGIFGRNAYYVGTYLSLGGFVAAELTLFMLIMCRVLGGDRKQAAIIALGLICMQVLLTPVPSEAFFWFCGAVRYTFVYALSLFLMAVWIVLYYDRGRTGFKRILSVAGMLFLTVAVAGSNYVTGLVMMLCYFFGGLWFFIKKNRYRYLMAAGVLVYLGAFLLNVAAPGNAVRQRASGTAHLPAVKSIILSLQTAGNYVLVNSILPCFILAALFAPLMIRILRRRDYRYPLPFLVTLFTWGIFAAQFTPNLYALGIAGTGRIQNLYRFTFYIFLYGNEFYWLGWFLRKNREQGDSVKEKGTGRSGLLLAGWLAGGGLFLLSLSVWGGSTVTSYSALQSLRRGEARQYWEEQQERLRILQDETVAEARLKPFSCAPYVLFFSDISRDGGDWLNQSVAEYFGKEKVILDAEEVTRE